MEELNAEVIQEVLLPKLEAQIENNGKLKPFVTLEDQMINIPRRSTIEHRKIAEYAKTPWAKKIVDARVQPMKVAGIRNSYGSDAEMWRTWKQWHMIQKEKAVYREAITYGDAHIELRQMAPGFTVPFNKDPFKFVAFYGHDDFNDAFNAEHPVLAMEKGSKGAYKVWDDRTVSIWEPTREGSDRLALVSRELHGADVVPVVRYANDIDSSGRSIGDIRPLTYLLLRIMKASYDSGMINHSNSWNVRYVAGMSNIQDIPKLPGETDEEWNRRLAHIEERMRVELSTSDILTSTDSNAKFGSLPATNPGQFVAVIEQMLKELAAVSNTPSDYLTGDIVAQSAEQSANSQANYHSMVQEKRDVFGESHETLLKLHVRMNQGDLSEFDSQVAWAENDNGAIAAKIDALGKAATMLKIPERVLWSMYPNQTPEKLQEWYEAADERDAQQAQAYATIAGMGNEGATPEMMAKDLELEA